MAASQPFSVALQGGLDKSSNSLELLQTPGKATRLKNFEVSTKGGYRRINGYTQLGDGTRPNSSNEILGMHVYADGVLASSGTNIYFSQDGNSWLQINKASVAGGGDNYSTFTGRSASARTSQSKTHFATFEGNTIYGEVIITDEGSGVKPFYFKMTGTDSDITNRTFFAKEITVSGTHYPKYCVIHDKHLVVAGAATALNTIFYSGTSDIDDFTSTGSGSIVLDDQVVGLKSFRDELFIFCKNSIYKLQNINNSSTIAIVPVTKNVGCVDGKTIQEFAGDLIFLAPDGFRTIAGTARIGDVELGTISSNVQSIFNENISSASEFDSIVIPDKTQYRIFFTKSGTLDNQTKGIICSLRGQKFEFAEIRGIKPASTDHFVDDGDVIVLHGGYADGFIYRQEVGNTFNGVNIAGKYRSPDLTFNDPGIRKHMQRVIINYKPEAAIDADLFLRYDYEDKDAPRPAAYPLDSEDVVAIYGTSVYGIPTYGGASQPLVRQAVEGSGFAVALRVTDGTGSAPYSLKGFQLEYQLGARR